jgi:hypothetical protein
MAAAAAVYPNILKMNFFFKHLKIETKLKHIK